MSRISWSNETVPRRPIDDRLAFAGGRTLAKIKAATGHASLLTTSVYLQVVVDEREEVGAPFAVGG